MTTSSTTRTLRSEKILWSFKDLSLQIATQKYVSELQAYNGMLQSAPGVLFTLVAGPLTDSWGRRPLILSALLGYLLLNLILLVNGFLNSKYFCITHHTLVAHS